MPIHIPIMFGFYAVLGVLALLLYRPLSPAIESTEEAPQAPLHKSKRLVYSLAVLFGMDSLGTGFLVQSLLALWLFQNFQISLATAATILFWSGIFSAISYLNAQGVADRSADKSTSDETTPPANNMPGQRAQSFLRAHLVRREYAGLKGSAGAWCGRWLGVGVNRRLPLERSRPTPRCHVKCIGAQNPAYQVEP